MKIDIKKRLLWDTYRSMCDLAYSFPENKTFSIYAHSLASIYTEKYGSYVPTECSHVEAYVAWALWHAEGAP